MVNSPVTTGSKFLHYLKTKSTCKMLTQVQVLDLLVVNTC